MAITLTFQSKARIQFLNITKQVQEAVSKIDVEEGVCIVYVPHTTAGITINESADPAVPADILAKLEEVVPQNGKYKHAEGNSDAHIKTLLTGSSVTIPIIHRKLSLGMWQAVFFCEYDGPRSRKVHLIIINS
ncbi:MAG: secondary thiamine-phosphate synthase enzyme YjbQ [Candidatus Hodarchaeota archaeon]